MFTVALIGLDGVGKTTVARLLEENYPAPLKYLYMGDNVEACNYMLPTTRWWKTRRRRQSRASTRNPTPHWHAHNPAATQRSPLRRVMRTGRKAIGFVNRVLEEAYRELISTWYARRGFIVLFDRHFVLDYYHYDILPQNGRRSLKRRLHGFLLRKINREPDLVICLDAPGQVAFDRKGEFSPEFLETRRQQYLGFGKIIRNFEVVDANRKLESVIQDVEAVISRYEESARQHEKS